VFEYTGGVQARDGKVCDGLDGGHGIGLRDLLSDLADFPGGSGGAQDEVHLVLTGL